jgi:methyltransferase family protein
METIRGRRSRELGFNGLSERLAGYDRIVLDLGTGDGRYVHHLAEEHPHCFFIGLDACRENLREHSRSKQPNMLFVIANAQELPQELHGLISGITINFPWGSLLDSLLGGDAGLMNGLESISRSAARLEVLLNGGALAEAGSTLETGAAKIRDNLLRYGWRTDMPRWMNSAHLRAFPSTWARRLAFGQDPRTVAMSGYLTR